MILEALLAYAHIAAVLALVVFITSETALCRSEWMNAAIVHRLVTLDRIYLGSAAAVLLSGLARAFWGMKGGSWYWTNGLLHLKLALFVLILLLSVKPARAYLRWRRTLAADGTLPDAAEVKAIRARVMLSAHLMALLPLAAVFLARGYGGR